MADIVKISNFDIPVTVKDKEDVFDELEFDSEEDRLICEDIIDFIEKNTASYLYQGISVLIPFIGTFYENPYSKAYKENSVKINKIREEQGEEAVKKFKQERLKEEFNFCTFEDKRQIKLNRLKKLNKRYYNKYAKIYGVDVAREMMFAFSRLEPIEFNEEVEEQLQLIYNENTT